MADKPLRRKSDGTTIPAKLVINYVGVALLISLVASAYLLIMGKDAAIMLAVTGSCVTGLIGLLGRTTPMPEPQGPTGAASDPVNIAAPPNAPVNVVETEATPPLTDDLKKPRAVPGAQFQPKDDETYGQD